MQSAFSKASELTYHITDAQLAYSIWRVIEANKLELPIEKAMLERDCKTLYHQLHDHVIALGMGHMIHEV